jgi:hypothetical protein
VSSEDIDARWNSLGAARKRTIIALLFDEILIRPVGKGLRRFAPASVSVRWREHAALEPDELIMCRYWQLRRSFECTAITIDRCSCVLAC